MVLYSHQLSGKNMRFSGKRKLSSDARDPLLSELLISLTLPLKQVRDFNRPSEPGRPGYLHSCGFYHLGVRVPGIGGS
jgi:hypothetical protein